MCASSFILQLSTEQQHQFDTMDTSSAISNEDKRWIDFYDKMGDGKIPYNSRFYVIDDYPSPPQEGSGDPPVQFVSPTQQQVDQARLQLKRNLTSKVKPVKKKKRRMTGGKAKRKTKPKAKPKKKTNKPKRKPITKRKTKTPTSKRGWVRK